MTSRKSPIKTGPVCFALLTSFVTSCGGDPTAFQEKTMSGLSSTEPTSRLETGTQHSANNSADAMVKTETSGGSSKDDFTDTAMESSSASIESTQKTSAGGESILSKNAPPADQLTLDFKESQLRFGSQTTTINALLNGEKTSDVTYTVSAPLGRDAGKVVNGTYMSPATGTAAYDVTLTARSKTNPALVTTSVVKLVPATQVFVGCTQDAKSFPIKAEIFPIPSTSTALPIFSLLGEKLTTVCMDSFQIPNRSWSDGFPGHPELIEWFALRASSRLTVATGGKYSFRLNADDGAKLYIDGELVVDNDGQHAAKAVTGAITLVAGDHELVMEYFQGPRYYIALELFWKGPGASTFTYVPTATFKP